MTESRDYSFDKIVSTNQFSIERVQLNSVLQNRLLAVQSLLYIFQIDHFRSKQCLVLVEHKMSLCLMTKGCG
jgi:hypothetical protein